MRTPLDESRTARGGGRGISRGMLFACALVLPSLLHDGAGGTAAAQGTVDSIPSNGYFSVVQAYADGNLVGAYKDFRLGTTHNGASPLAIICFHAMAGECLYQLGQSEQAVEHFDACLRTTIASGNWMLQLQIPPQALRPASVPVRQIPWAVKTRPTGRADLTDRYPLTTTGGVLASNPQIGTAVIAGGMARAVVVPEVVRCVALALRRRTELLGPYSAHSPLTRDIVAFYSAPLGPPNHWMQSWISLQRGLALAAAGRVPEAVGDLQASLVVGGLDHPLTGVALLELAKLAAADGKFEIAATTAMEAVYTAAEHGDSLLVGESLQALVLIRLRAGEVEVHPSLAPAIAWARDTVLAEALLVATLAENLCAAQQGADALPLLAQLRRRLVRQWAGLGRVRARLEFQGALAGYQTGRGPQADVELQAALGFLQGGSVWRYQIGKITQAYASGSLGSRVAGDLLETLLRDPTSADWLASPMESLATLVFPQEEALEAWFLIAVERKEPLKGLQILDLARRRRFYGSLPLGGRLLSLRWLLDGPPEALSDEARLQRQRLLDTRPALVELLRAKERAGAELRARPLVEPDAAAERQQEELSRAYAEAAARLEIAIRALALDRVPVELVFPPRVDMVALRERLAPGQLVLQFAALGRGVHGFALTRQELQVWEIESPQQLRAELAAFLESLGSRTRTSSLPREDLAESRWRDAAAKVARRLLPPAIVGATSSDGTRVWGGIDELIVIPDGILWYVPFEALPDETPDARPMIERRRVRYAPLLSLALPTPRLRPPAGVTAFVPGRLVPRDTDEGAEELRASLDDYFGEVPRLATLLGPSALVAGRCERLFVWSDLADTGRATHAWAPLGLDRNQPDSTLASWLQLPWGAPRQLVLPGFHSGAEQASKLGDGQELFLASCGLFACGTRSALLSRWTVGGASARQLIREYARGLPELPAAEAWQRSVLLLRTAELDPNGEPRLQPHDELVSGGHPLLWAGYLLVDQGDPP